MVQVKQKNLSITESNWKFCADSLNSNRSVTKYTCLKMDLADYVLHNHVSKIAQQKLKQTIK